MTRRSVIGAVSTTAVLLVIGYWSVETYIAREGTLPALVAGIAASDVIELTNAERADNGLAPLVESAALRRAAQLKADDMAREQYYAHVSPDGEGLQYWLGQAGYRYLNAGENLVVDRTSAKQAVDAWMGSRTHRDNIMRSQFTEIGVGIAEGKYKGQDTIYVVQMFGTPARITPLPAPQRTPAPKAITKPVTVTITVPVAPPTLPTITPITTPKSAPVSTTTIPAKRDPLVTAIESRATPLISRITANVVAPTTATTTTAAATSTPPAFSLPTWAEPITIFDTPQTVIQSNEVAVAQRSSRPEWVATIAYRLSALKSWLFSQTLPITFP